MIGRVTEQSAAKELNSPSGRVGILCSAGGLQSFSTDLDRLILPRYDGAFGMNLAKCVITEFRCSLSYIVHRSA
jgi:hypothetical protein